MNLRVLGAFGGEGPGQRPTAFLVNEHVLLDAGSVAGALRLPEQARIDQALVSHAHLDHVAGLAYLVEGRSFADDPRPVTVASIAPVVDGLRGGLFNGVLWPDFTRLPEAAPVLAFRTLGEDAEARVGELSVRPIRVAHAVPAVGFLVHDGTTGLVYSGDTGPTHALWEAARREPGVRAVVLECAFPDRLEALALKSGHLTPGLVRRELDKLPADAAVWIFHVKAQFAEEIGAELARVDAGGRLGVVEQDKTYTL
jgi:ribonuclease BN (tRNA processing enzyme)